MSLSLSRTLGVPFGNPGLFESEKRSFFLPRPSMVSSFSPSAIFPPFFVLQVLSVVGSGPSLM